MTLDLLTSRWNRLLRLNWILKSGGIGLLITALVGVFLGTSLLQTLWFLPVLWIGLYALNGRSGLKRATNQSMAQHLNRIDPRFQESAELLTREPSQLNLLEQLQRVRLQPQLDDLDPKPVLARVTPWKSLAFFLLATGSAVLLFLFLPRIRVTTGPPTAVETAGSSQPELAAPNLITVMVQPPAYTGLEAYEQHDPSLLVPEGSEVSWNISTSQALARAELVFGSGVILPLTRIGDGHYQGTGKPEENGYYALALEDELGQTWKSEFFKLLIARDLPPEIRVLAPLAERSLVNPHVQNQFTIQTAIQDDYGITAVKARLTLARGLGESVKFQQQELAFPQAVSGQKNGEWELTLDFRELQLKAGDEAYIQVEALDNRPQDPNRSRSAMFVLHLTGEQDKKLAAMEGIGINPIPDYFRSQRQIIIDTEKLIQDSSQISAAELGKRGNSLGLDQKILRLRYGKFLGEEFTRSLGPAAPEDQEHDSDHHQEEGQTTRADGQKVVSLEDMDHDHEPTRITGSTSLMQSDLMAAYVHNHDGSEEGTYLPQQVQEKLRACLAQMWDSERYLRLSQPMEALPFQYRALELLKEVQQADRVYIQRLDTESPPIDVATVRFSGELDEIRAIEAQGSQTVDPDIQVLKQALLAAQSEIAGTDPAVRSWQEVYDLVSRKAGQEPELWLDALNRLKKLELETDLQKRKPILEDLVRDLWRLLPLQDLHPLPRQVLPGQRAQEYLFPHLENGPPDSAAGGKP